MRTLIILFFSINTAYSTVDMSGVFGGRVSKLNEPASMVRVKVDFTNFKYLSKNDRVEFWHETADHLKCSAFVIGKSSEYILLKVPEYDFCKSFVPLTAGGYLRFYSQDLVNNLKMGRELVDILLKKRLAMHGKYSRRKKEVSTHINRVNALNLRYKTLRDKLEAEWRDAIAALEEDHISSKKKLQDLEIELDNIDFKLEKYKIEDSNLKTDRWALDPRLYYKK